jgi:hypothetical protein
MISVKVKGSFMAQFDAAKKLAEEKRKKELLQQLKDATPVDTGEARDGWVLEGDSLVNRVDHIETLNQGHSKQAPTYFIEQTLLANSDIKPSGTIVRSK